MFDGPIITVLVPATVVMYTAFRRVVMSKQRLLSVKSIIRPSGRVLFIFGLPKNYFFDVCILVNGRERARRHYYYFFFFNQKGRYYF